MGCLEPASLVLHQTVLPGRQVRPAASAKAGCCCVREKPPPPAPRPDSRCALPSCRGRGSGELPRGGHTDIVRAPLILGCRAGVAALARTAAWQPAGWRCAMAQQAALAAAAHECTPPPPDTHVVATVAFALSLQSCRQLACAAVGSPAVGTLGLSCLSLTRHPRAFLKCVRSFSRIQATRSKDLTRLDPPPPTHTHTLGGGGGGLAACPPPTHPPPHTPTHPHSHPHPPK
jgi:hypothetical protein